MAHINLLPWREEQRSEQTRQFITIAALCVILTLAVLLLVHVSFNNQIDYQNQRNTLLQNEINALNLSLKQISTLEGTRDKLLSRMDIIQSLQQQRPQIVHLFDDLCALFQTGSI